MATLKLYLKVGAIKASIYVLRQLYLANEALKEMHDEVPKNERALIEAGRAIGLSEIDISRLISKINKIMEETNND